MDALLIGLITGFFGLFATVVGLQAKNAAEDRAELTKERAEHRATEAELDAERKVRRAAEERESKLTRENARLTEVIERLAGT